MAARAQYNEKLAVVTAALHNTPNGKFREAAKIAHAGKFKSPLPESFILINKQVTTHHSYEDYTCQQKSKRYLSPKSNCSGSCLHTDNKRRITTANCKTK